MDISRVFVLVLTTSVCTLLQVPYVVCHRRASIELNAFKDYVRQEMSLMTSDILNLNDKMDQLGANLDTKRDRGVVGEARERVIEDEKGMAKQTEIINGLLQKNNILHEAFQSEKTLNRQLQRRVDTLNGIVEDLVENGKSANKEIEAIRNAVQTNRETIRVFDNNNVRMFSSLQESTSDSLTIVTSSLTSINNTIESIQQQCNSNIRDIRGDVNRVDKKVDNVTADLRGMVKKYGNMKESVKTINENAQGLDKNLKDDIMEQLKADEWAWVVFMRRQDGSENFTRPWVDYKNGFGNRNGEFWAGNDLLHTLTTSKPTELQIEMVDNDGEKKYAQYDNFEIGPESDKYRLSLSGYKGNAGDSLIQVDGVTLSDGQQFSTFDSANDNVDGYCADTYGGGWWYNQCGYALLTSTYTPGRYKGIIWYTWTGWNKKVKFVEMKIRQATF